MAPTQVIRDESGLGLKRKHRLGINILLRYNFVIDDSRLV